jgi:RNA-binding protein
MIDQMSSTTGPTPSLTPRQRAALKSMGNPLKASLWVGREGVSPEVASELERLLAAHELVKVKLSGAATTDRQTLADELARASASAVVQVIGRSVLLYRRRADARPPGVPPAGEGG